MVYGVYSICPYVLWDSKQNLNYTGVLVHFDDRYLVMFPMAKSMFPQFKRENSLFKEAKN